MSFLRMNAFKDLLYAYFYGLTVILCNIFVLSLLFDSFQSR